MKRICVVLLCAAMLLCGCSAQHSGDATMPTYFGDTNDTAPNSPGAETKALSMIYDPSEQLNPYKSENTANRALFSLVYQGLFSVNREYDAEPVLCQGYSVTSDLKTYTFYLAKALFSDGSAVTAADVVASLNTAMESRWYGGRLQQVKSISAYGEAVVIELKNAMAELPLLLDIPVVKAAEVDAAHPVGTGPYRLEIAGDTAVLRRQAAWWCNGTLPVYGDTIPLVKGESQAQIRDAFEFEGVSLVVSDPGSDRYADFRSDYELWSAENGKMLYLVCNEKSKVFSDPAIRRALTHAIDRELIAEEYYQSIARPASLPASPASPWYNSSLAQRFGYAPELFAEAITTAVAEGRILDTNVTILLNGDDVIRHRAGLAIADMLRAGGLKVSIIKSSAEDLVENLKYTEYDLYLGQTKLSANMDISAFFGANTTLNYGGLNDPALYQMCLDAMTNAGNFYKLHEAVMEEGQLCPILFQGDAVFVRRGVMSNLSPARDNVFHYSLGRTLEDALIQE